MNTPNKLTVLRICLIPVFVALLLWERLENHYIYAWVVFIVAAVTDAIDGHLARKNNLVTDFGKFLDPLADKMLVTSALIVFIDLNLAPSLAVLIIIFREFLVTSLRLIASANQVVIAANIWGKIKTVAQMVAIPLILLLKQLEDMHIIVSPGGSMVPPSAILTLNVNYVSNVLIWILAVITVMSGATYVWQNRKILLDSK